MRRNEVRNTVVGILFLINRVKTRKQEERRRKGETEREMKEEHKKAYHDVDTILLVACLTSTSPWAGSDPPPVFSPLLSRKPKETPANLPVRASEKGKEANKKKRDERGCGVSTGCPEFVAAWPLRTRAASVSLVSRG